MNAYDTYVDGVDDKYSDYEGHLAEDFDFDAYTLDGPLQEEIETFSSPTPRNQLACSESSYEHQTEHAAHNSHKYDAILYNYAGYQANKGGFSNDTGSTMQNTSYTNVLKPNWEFHQRDLAAGNNRNANYHPISSYKPPIFSRGQTRTNGNNASRTTSNAMGEKAGSLQPVSSLPDVYRAIFNFGVFNAMQSKCFDNIFNFHENMVISAPTGSGKTVLFELAMIQMIQAPENIGMTWKCVYIAPTKALCSEKHRDWSKKFEPLGIKCCELTGDTVLFGKGAWGDARSSSIIVTTAEKWDSLTRNWGDNARILSSIHLFLVDEVHILNETRGSTLEAVISRMKSLGSSVRFILVSATVPNIVDVACWIGSSENPGTPAQVCEFGEEYRPCKLTRVVVGVYRPRTQNDFVFNKTLDYKLFGVLQQHSAGKPILVFCSTRKGVSSTAEQLVKEFTEAEKTRQKLPWSRPARSEAGGFEDKRVADFASYGIGIHHAGLSPIDRRQVEDLYLKKVLRVVVATSTLAVGVNLPAHLVVIKGVQTFQNNASVEYSDLDIMQMLGRAGRPQFDKDGIAIILCEEQLENKYRALVQGKTILESSLHVNLSEHLNSEVGLGTITSVNSAKDWLRSSFMFQRIQKNPAHYCINKDEAQTWEERVDELVMESLSQLRNNHLIEGGKDVGDALHATEYGDIMSKFYIRQTTMSMILALPESPTLRELLEMLSAAEEFHDIKLRASEKSVLAKLRKHTDIRYEMLKVEKSADKVFLLVQAFLSGIPLNAAEYRSGDSQLYLETLGVFRHSTRIARALVEVGIAKSNATLIKNGLELVRCLTAKAWEDRPVVLRQISGIGEKSLLLLAEHGITSIDKLRSQNPQRIEVLLKRNPPFGLEVLAAVKELPHYALSVNQTDVRSSRGIGPVEIDLVIDCGLLNPENSNGGSKTKKQKLPKFGMTAVLTITSDMTLLDFRRIPTKALKQNKAFSVSAELTKPSQSIIVIVCAESIAGVTVVKTLRPNVAADEYPTMNTRPPTSTEVDLAGLEDDPDFWNIELDKSEEKVQIRDLTNTQSKRAVQSTTSKAPSNHDQIPPKKSSPKKLSNGRFACNHPCRDKTKCRHLCCRDGLPDPPLPSKKKILGDGPTLKVRDKVKPARKEKLIENCLSNLDDLHQNTNIRKNIQLSPGRRLTIGSGLPTRRKEPLPSFDVKFADLGDTQRLTDSPDSQQEVMTGTGFEADDLPEAHHLLRLVSQRSPQSAQNSDFDDTWTTTEADTHSSHPNQSQSLEEDPQYSSGTSFRYTSPKKPKRELSPLAWESPRKRNRAEPKTDTWDAEPDFPEERPTKVIIPLFFDPSSDMEDNDHKIHDEFWTLSSDDSAFCKKKPGTSMCTRTTGAASSGRSSKETEERLLCDPISEDEFDELDAFLNSNAVEIV